MNSSGLSSPLRSTVSFTSEPGLPRMRFTASERLMPLSETSSSFTMRSPAWIPALYAGVSSIGETTFTKPSSAPTSMPSPPNSPCVPTWRSRYASWSRNAECGSRSVTMPLIAPFRSLRSSTGST